jgi:hypothetical protein
MMPWLDIMLRGPRPVGFVFSSFTCVVMVIDFLVIHFASGLTKEITLPGILCSGISHSG